ncbi:MAG: 4Fe-4S binding protein [Dehalococcoidia bacterium]
MGAPGVDLDTLEPQFASDTSIAGTSAAKYIGLRALQKCQDFAGKVDISGHGGIHGWKDIVENILYGANSVQVLTICMRRGFRVIPAMKRGLADYMDEHQFATIQDMRGLAIPKLLHMEQLGPMMAEAYLKLKGTVVARVDESKCDGCEICWEVCRWNAISIRDKLAVVDRSLCEGCNMCGMACPKEALSLDNMPLYYQTVRELAKPLQRA